MRTPEETQRLHGERVEARQRERAWDGTSSHARIQNSNSKALEDFYAAISGPDPYVSLDENPGELTARLSGRQRAKRAAADTIFTAMLLDIIAHAQSESVAGIEREINMHATAAGDETGGEPAAFVNAPAPGGERFPSTAELLQARYTDVAPPTQERIDPIDENQPPFFRFWTKLNAGLKAAGKPDADHKTAMTAFEGGPTPVGALTFIGKEWDGIRAVPVQPALPGRLAPAYHGEFRQVSDEGTIWRTVHNHSGPREFPSAEGALNGAKHAKKHSEDHG